jgi:hypothetical protein
MSAMSMGGGEAFRVRFNPNTNVATTTIRMGFGDTTTVASPVDGCYGSSVNLVLTGYCSNAGNTATATTYTMSANTWYTLVGKMNSANTVFTFYLYNDAGTLLWSDTVSSNIPSGAGNDFGAELIATQSTSSSGAILVTWDSFEVWIDRPMGRALN